jgi:Reverse transcriptase (RNA-dependent DNA polymerase)
MECPCNVKVLPVRWVFVYKFDTDRYFEKFKVRLCVRGDLQESSHEDNYVAMLAVWTFRALMAITAAYDLEARQYDAVSTFTNSELHDIIYIECPDGFKEHNTCLLLLRALYGLCQSPLLWLKDLTSTLTTLGL